MTAEGVHRLEMRTSAIETKAEELERSLRSLREDVELLETRFGHTDDLDYELRDIREDLEDSDRSIQDLKDQHDGMESELGATDRAVGRLVRQVRLLEGRVQAADGVAEADFETFTAKQRELAQQMLRRYDLEADLFDATDRRRRQITINGYHQTQQSRRRNQDQALETAAQLLALDPVSSQHENALRAFRKHVKEERRLAGTLQQEALDAEEARSELAADDEERAQCSPAVHAGERAEQRLLTDLRSRIAEAVGARRLLPVWFSTVLGPAPPPVRTQEWLEAATQLLLYRLAYKVEDRVVSLGKEVDSRSHRGRWRTQLVQSMARVR